MSIPNLRVALVRPRFPENIGMVARACANMGCDDLAIVCPELWKIKPVLSLATPKGKRIIESCQFFPDLPSALASSGRVYATTARTGGWRKRVLSPEKCADEVVEGLRRGLKITLVFGPEDKGLTNEEIVECKNIVHIPTRGEASSLNLAQAALILLYECARCYFEKRSPVPDETPDSIRYKEMAVLEKEFKRALSLLDCLHGKNPDYYFTQWSALLDRMNLNRKEYAAFMGLCRQINNKLSRR